MENEYRVPAGHGWVFMSKKERARLRRLQRRCDWLQARIAIGEDRGKERSFDAAELSALKWAIERISTTPDELWMRVRQLEAKVLNQRQIIRDLVAQLHGIVLDEPG